MASPAVTFPDAELMVVDHLRPLLGGVTVGTMVPNPLSPPMVLIHRVGGTRRASILDIARIDVQVWAASSKAAADLAAQVRFLLHGMPQQVESVYGAEDFLGPTLIPDPETQLPRYLLTVELSVRGIV